MRSKRNLIFTVIVGIAAVLGYMSLNGVKFPPDGTEGAIGAAKRYASPQISDQDVAVTDQQVQAFVQSDLFRRLATDREFRNVMLSPEYQKLVQLDAFRNVTASAE